MRILLVEDDELLAEALAEALNDQRYVVDVAHDGEAGWDQSQILEYDLILLDVMLPKLDGFSLCRRLRSRQCNIPILMLTARETSTDKVTGLDAGADDYLVKPVDLPELLARIRAILRRGTISGSPVLTWGELELDPSSYKVTYNRQLLHLTPKEYSFLELFLRNGERVFSRHLLVEHLWSLEEPPGDETIRAHIKSLRHKLRGVGAPEDMIETVHGIGYRLKSGS
jgi:DNA-binding response OmpR family regulator